MGMSNWIYLDVEEIVRETDKAFLLRLEEGEEVWIPKAQIRNSDDFEVGDRNCTVDITEWIAEQKGLV